MFVVISYLARWLLYEKSDVMKKNVKKTSAKILY